MTKVAQLTADLVQYRRLVDDLRDLLVGSSCFCCVCVTLRRSLASLDSGGGQSYPDGLEDATDRHTAPDLGILADSVHDYVHHDDVCPSTGGAHNPGRDGICIRCEEVVAP